MDKRRDRESNIELLRILAIKKIKLPLIEI